MINTIKQQRYWVIVLCLGIVAGAYYLLLSPNTSQNPLLYYGIAGDLILTSPAIYWFVTKSHTLKKTISILLLALGAFTYLTFAPNSFSNPVKNLLTVALPVIELGIFSFTIYKFRAFLKTIDWSKDDVFMAVNKVTRQAFENKVVAKVVASEFCMFYYSLFAWKKVQPKANEFTYHKTGSSAVLYAVIGLVLIETAAVHFLLMQWNTVVAYILLGLSVYTAIQIFAHIKAKSRRFIQFKDDRLILKNGLSNYFEIPFDQIERIEKDTLGSVDKGILQGKFGLMEDLESHNIKITFHSALSYEKLYGMKGKAKTLLLQVDQESAFIEAIQSKLTL